MTRKIKLNILEKPYIAEELALKFYANAGYTITTNIEDLYMHNSKHPQEQMFLKCAYDAIEYFSKYP